MIKNFEVQTTEKLSTEHFIGIDKYSKIAVIVDENTEEHCYPKVKKFLPEHILIKTHSGEEYKNLKTCYFIWECLTNAEFDRKGLVINLGGGVIGDMGGFCASTYKRGIDFMQFPTTLLSQVDASVGGKLGIDFKMFKNQIGVFRHPNRVVISSEFLTTLPERELRSGFAEVLKHSLIADSYKWQMIIRKSLHEQNWYNTINHSVHIKSKIVTEDPEEKGLRKILNFGHTIGHAIESFYLDNEKEQKFLHGEAIAIGMICEAYISMKQLFLSQEDLISIQNYIIDTYGKVSIPTQYFDEIIPLARHDKKNENGETLCTLLKGIGDALFNKAITEKDIRESLEYYNTL